jgi:phospholipase C
MAQSPRTTEPRVEHLIVLMLENRSFDHMLGFLAHPKPEFAGLRGAEHHNISKSGQSIPATSDGEPHLADPDHSFEGVRIQLQGYGDVPFNGGFVRSYEQQTGNDEGWRVMQCLDPESRCPVLATLAKEFAVCDYWFSSVPGETWPNRNFAHAATSDAATNIELGFYYDPTIFQQLSSSRATWRIYHDGPPQVWCFPRLWRQPSFLGRLLHQRSRIGNWYLQPEFYKHVAAEDLPSYSFIEPQHYDLYDEVAQNPQQTNSQHPHNNRENPRDFYAGESLIKNIYEALVARPSLFAKTLLVITYDEHGGLYDHINPPSATPPGDPVWRGWSRRFTIFVRAIWERLRGQSPKLPQAFGFDRLGVRVPAVLVSPWIKPGTVIHHRLEHASIPATLRALFAPKLRSLTQRDGKAGTFHQIVSEQATSAPRPYPQGPASPDSPGSETVRDGGLPPLPVLKTVVVTAEAERLKPGEAQQPRSELDMQLLALSERVNQEIQRESDTIVRRPTASAKRVSRLEGGPIDLGIATEASNRFAAAAAEARRK